MSAHTELLTWARLQVIAADIVPSTSVKVRKRPVWVKGDASPLVILSPGDEVMISRDTGGYVTMSLPVHVVIVEQVSQSYGDPTWLLDARAALRVALLKPKPTDAARLTGYNPNPTLPLDSFPEGFDVSPQTFVYHAGELVGRD